MKSKIREGYLKEEIKKTDVLKIIHDIQKENNEKIENISRFLLLLSDDIDKLEEKVNSIEIDMNVVKSVIKILKTISTK